MTERGWTAIEDNLTPLYLFAHNEWGCPEYQFYLYVAGEMVATNGQNELIIFEVDAPGESVSLVDIPDPNQI